MYKPLINILLSYLTQKMKYNLKKPSSLQRWLEIIVGILYLPITLLLVFISILFIIVSLDSETSIINILGVFIIGGIILISCIWLASIPIRLILNKEISTKLDEHLPRWVLSLFYIIMINIVIFKDDFFENLLNNIIVILFFSSTVGALLINGKKLSRNNEYKMRKKKERMSKPFAVLLILIAVFTILILTFPEFFTNIFHQIIMTEMTNQKKYLLIFIGISFYIGLSISSYFSWKREEKQISQGLILASEFMDARTVFFFSFFLNINICNSLYFPIFLYRCIYTHII